MHRWHPRRLSCQKPTLFLTASCRWSHQSSSMFDHRNSMDSRRAALGKSPVLGDGRLDASGVIVISSLNSTKLASTGVVGMKIYFGLRCLSWSPAEERRQAVNQSILRAKPTAFSVSGSSNNSRAWGCGPGSTGDQLLLVQLACSGHSLMHNKQNNQQQGHHLCGMTMKAISCNPFSSASHAGRPQVAFLLGVPA